MRLVSASMKFMFVVLSACLFSCSKNEEVVPVTKAAITGSVNLYDEATNPLDKSGMTVTVVGTSPLITAVTDADGKFTLSDVPFGTYSLQYEKPGYGTFKKFAVQHSNSGSSTIITSTPSLGKISGTAITNLSVTTAGSNIVLSATTNPAGSSGNRRYVRYFLSASPTVGSSNYSYVSPGLVSQINPYDATLTASNLISWGFTSGQTVYARFYGDSFWSNEYEDGSLGRRVFPNLNAGASNIVSFIVP